MTIRPSVLDQDQLTPTRRRLALFALALGGFGIGSSEFVSMGLLPGIAGGLLPDQMAADPAQGIATAGHAITAYALGVVVGAPLLSLLAVRMSRRTLIIVLAGALAAGTLISGLMPTFELTVAARFLAGVPHGAYFGVASLLAASLMGPGNQGKGVALALSGLTVANLIGVPVLTAVGQSLGWRVVYALIAGLFVVTVLALLATVPAQEKPQGRRASDEMAAFGRLQLWVVMGLSAVGLAGAFAVFSYVADITVGVAGASPAAVPYVLAAAGLGMTIGNVIGGAAADRSVTKALMVSFPLYVLALLLLFELSGSLSGLIIGFFAVNLVNSSIGPALQTWLIRVARRSAVLGASLNHAAFNIANAMGAALGGSVIAAGLGYRAPILAAAGLAVVGFLLTAGALLAVRVRADRRLAQLRTVEIPVLVEQKRELVGSAS